MFSHILSWVSSFAADAWPKVKPHAITILTILATMAASRLGWPAPTIEPDPFNPIGAVVRHEPAPTDYAPLGVGLASIAAGAIWLSREDGDDADLDVERSWRDVRREAKRKRRELRNQPDGVRQSALAVLIWPFLQAVYLWAKPFVGELLIKMTLNALEMLRKWFPQSEHWRVVGQWFMDQPLDSPVLGVPVRYEPRIATGPAPKLDDLGITHINVRIPPAPIPAPAPEGSAQSLGSKGDPDSMTRLGAWKNPPRTGE